MSLQDFLVSNQEYNTVIFLNAFSLSDSERKAVQKKIRKANVTTVWLVAPGSVTKNGFSDKAMCDLTGIKLSGSGVLPNVKCVDTNVKQLPGNAVIKVLPDKSKAVFSAVLPKSGTQWQQLLGALGVHAYIKPESYFRRHGNLFMFHTGKKGLHTITLPEKSGMVTELFSGKKYSLPVIKIQTNGPTTQLFKLQNR